MIDFEKMKRFSLILEKIMMVLSIIGMVLLGVLLLIELVVLIVPGSAMIFDSTMFNVTEQIIVFIKALGIQTVTSDIALKPIILAFIPFMMLQILFYVINTWQLKNILFSIKVDKPFSHRNEKSLLIMSITFLVASIAITNVESLFMDHLFRVLELPAVGFLSFDVNWTLLFTGLMLLVLTGVFKYGNYLQEEYDETV